MTSLRRLLVATLLVIHCVAAAAPPKVACTFDEHGLASLSCDGVQLLKSSTPIIGWVNFADDKGANVPADKNNPTVSFERTAQRLSYSWPWGAMRFRYELAGTRLNIEFTLENDTAGPLSDIHLSLLELRFPHRPAGLAWEKRFQITSDNEDEVTAIAADYQSGMVTFCNDDPTSIVRSGFSPWLAPPEETWGILVAAPERYRPGIQFRVEPRSSKTFHFSLRFSEPGAPLKTFAGDLIEKFVAAHPFQLKWPDRRPIGMISLASSVSSSPTNPRGGFTEPNEKFVGKNGIKHFRERILAVADRSIGLLKSMGAQGMIFWDMEGEQFPIINYVGDPRMTEQLAPEMAAVAPEFFARFHNAGMRTGVCIRPSRIVPGFDGKSKWQHSHMGFDVVEEMNQKIIYAKKNLGCLLFYVDSNVRYFNRPDGSVDAHLLEGPAFKRLADAHPDVLIIPEIPQLDYWSCTAPYQELRPNMLGNHAATNPRVLEFYPRAFSVINPMDGPAEKHRDEIIAGQRRGDSLLFRCWFADEQNKVFKSILNEANRK